MFVQNVQHKLHSWLQSQQKSKTAIRFQKLVLNTDSQTVMFTKFIQTLSKLVQIQQEDKLLDVNLVNQDSQDLLLIMLQDSLIWKLLIMVWPVQRMVHTNALQWCLLTTSTFVTVILMNW